MNKITKCDVCGSSFNGGFLVDVSRQGGFCFTNAEDDWFETGEIDVCRECYYKVKEMVSFNISNRSERSV